MSLAHVLLTSLIEKPSNGIELARRFDRSMGFFWNATHQQIYRELNTMLKKGWISTLEDEDSSSRRKTYQVEVWGGMNWPTGWSSKARLHNYAKNLWYVCVPKPNLAVTASYPN